MEFALVLSLVGLGVTSMLVSTISGGGANVAMLPVLVLSFGLSPGDSIGTAFLALVLGSSAAALRFFKKGHLDVKRGLILGAATIPGTVLGSLISYLSEGIPLEIPLGVVVIGLAVTMVVQDRRSVPRARLHHLRGGRGVRCGGSSGGNAPPEETPLKTPGVMMPGSRIGGHQNLNYRIP